MKLVDWRRWYLEMANMQTAYMAPRGIELRKKSLEEFEHTFRLITFVLVMANMMSESSKTIVICETLLPKRGSCFTARARFFLHGKTDRH